MTLAYFNCPAARVSCHGGAGCPHIQVHAKPEQRALAVTPHNIEAVKASLRRGDVRFAASMEFNDLWVEVSLGSRQEELDLVESLRAILAERSKPFARARLEVHCP